MYTTLHRCKRNGTLEAMRSMLQLAESLVQTQPAVQSGFNNIHWLAGR
jgi:hypothetical protein